MNYDVSKRNKVSALVKLRGENRKTKVNSKYYFGHATL